MSVRTQGRRPGMSRSVIIRFRVNQKSGGRSLILYWIQSKISAQCSFLFAPFAVWSYLWSWYIYNSWQIILWSKDDSDFYGFSLVCGVVTLMLIVCVLLVHWQIYNESINHLSLVAVWCRGLWSDVGDKTRSPPAPPGSLLMVTNIKSIASSHMVLRMTIALHL